jgi:CubicO group peptidase (beta-lactamase class C family)
MEKTLTSGFLAPGKPIGVSIAVLRDGKTSLFALGAARRHSLFEIGSLTCIFTGLLMAQLVEQQVVRPGTPVRELLPPGVVVKPPGREITLLDLVTQHSGLPNLPDDLGSAGRSNPYVDFSAQDLYAFVGKHGVARPETAAYLDSNLGFRLLGQVLSDHARIEYRKLIRIKVLDPLGLRNTGVSLPPGQQWRFMLPYNSELQMENAWDLSALTDAGAMRSSAADMLKYLRALLDSDRLAGLTLDSRSLPAALRRTQELLADAQPGQRIGYAWIHDTGSGTYWRHGAATGFTSAAFFNPKGKFAGVVLTNLGADGRGNLAGTLSEHIQQRLAGTEAVSLDAW